ncbi:MAG: glycosyltransferase [Clostridium sp.]
MENKTLSVCLIVKNEEKNLIRCLMSINNIADEIIVVDTGSTDNTIEMARSLGAKVIESKWKNDFSDARNTSLQYATKDWILFLDADEEIPCNDGEKLKLILNDPKNSHIEGLYLRLVNIIDGNNVGDSVVFRAFKNDSDYRFVGKMHEQIINSVQDKKGTESIGSTDVNILHYGYDPSLCDQSKKCERNINLLLSYEDKDKDGYYYYSLGNEYTRTGSFENALETYNKALLYPKIENGNLPIYYPYLMVSIMKVLHALKRFKEELNYIENFKKVCSDFKDLYFNEALIYIERSNFSKAKKALTKHLNCSNNLSNYTYPSNNFDQYNIPNIMKQLEVASIDHDENLISSVIICHKESNTIIETLKSLSEVSHEIIVAIPNSLNIDTNNLINLGALIVKTKSCNEDEMFFEVLKKCHSKYTLKILLGEILSSVSQQELVKLLTNTKKNILKLNIINMENEIICSDIRIFNNNKRFKKYNDFKNYFKDKKIEITSITIHRAYEVYSDKIPENTLRYFDNTMFENKKILIGSILTFNETQMKDFFESLVKINSNNLIVTYFLMSNPLYKHTTDKYSEILKKDSHKVIIKDFESVNSSNETNLVSNSILYKDEIIHYMAEEQYDYLLLLDSKIQFPKDILYILLNSEEDIIVNEDFKNTTENSILFISREAILDGVNFNPIKYVTNNNENLNLLIRSQVLGFNVVSNSKL